MCKAEWLSGMIDNFILGGKYNMQFLTAVRNKKKKKSQPFLGNLLYIVISFFGSYQKTLSKKNLFWKSKLSIWIRDLNLQN